MPIALKTFAVAGDKIELNASEALSGIVCACFVGTPTTPVVSITARPVGSPLAAYQPIQAVKLADGTLVSSITVAGLYRVDASGALIVKFELTSIVAGSFDVYPSVSLG